LKRYFEYVGADAARGTSNSSKFWEVWIEGSTLYTRFGKIGANGQTTIKEFPNTDAAQTALDKAVAEKIKKGYVEEGLRSPRDVRSIVTSSELSGHTGAGALIKTLERIWTDDSALDQFEPDEATFAGFATADWIKLADYMHTKTSYAYGARTWDQFKAQSSVDQPFDLTVYELLSEAGWSYFESEFEGGVSSEAIACLGFLGNMTARFNFNGTHFDFTKVENTQREVRYLDELFAPSEFSKSKVQQVLKTCSDGLELLSDQALSLLSPHVTHDTISQELLSSVLPQAGVFNHTMSSLMCVFNEEIETPSPESLLISPRSIHLLMDTNNTVPPWWTEMYLWQDCVEEWKNSKLFFEPGEEHYSVLATLLENALDIKRHPNRDIGKLVLEDKEMFESLLSFLNGSGAIDGPGFCVRCGAAREGSGKFCSGCGHQH